MNIDSELEERVRQAGSVLADSTPSGLEFEELTASALSRPTGILISGRIAFFVSFALVVLVGGLVAWATGLGPFDREAGDAAGQPSSDIIGEFDSLPLIAVQQDTHGILSFEGVDWYLTFYEENIDGSDDINLCWEFWTPDRGPGGFRVLEMECERLEIPGFGVDHEDFTSLAWCCLRFELDDAWVWVAQDRPGYGGYLEVGRSQSEGSPQYIRIDGWRMPLSGVDLYVYEFPKDNPFDIVKHINPEFE